MRTMTTAEFRRALDHLGLTQQQLAEALRLSRRAVHGYANGKPIPVPTQMLLRVIVNTGIELIDAETPIPPE